MIDWHYVNSSTVEAIGYCGHTHRLYVRFLGNREYVYYDVGADVFGEFRRAESKGKYLHQYIKGHYAYNEL